MFAYFTALLYDFLFSLYVQQLWGTNIYTPLAQICQLHKRMTDGWALWRWKSEKLTPPQSHKPIFIACNLMVGALGRRTVRRTLVAVELLVPFSRSLLFSIVWRRTTMNVAFSCTMQTFLFIFFLEFCNIFVICLSPVFMRWSVLSRIIKCRWTVYFGTCVQAVIWTNWHSCRIVTLNQNMWLCYLQICNTTTDQPDKQIYTGAWVTLTNTIDSLHLIGSEEEVQTAESSLWVHRSDLSYTLKFPVSARKLPAVQPCLSPQLRDFEIVSFLCWNQTFTLWENWVLGWRLAEHLVISALLLKQHQGLPG